MKLLLKKSTFTNLLISNLLLTLLAFTNFTAKAQTVTCPAETNIGTFDCNTITDAPPLVNSLEDALEYYNIIVEGALPQTGAVTIDSDLVWYCPSDAREVTREVIIYNDDNYNFQYDAGEEISSCTFTIRTEPDLQPFSFTAPPDFTSTTPICDLDSQMFSYDITIDWSVDECPSFNDITAQSTEATVIAGDCPGEQIILRIWTLTDVCGNLSEPQTQTITVIDNTPPEFTVPADITVACGIDPMDASITGNVTDRYDEGCEAVEIAVNATIVDELTQENTPCPGATSYTKRWTVVDGCGNTTTKDQIILVECPPDCSNQDICVGDIVTDPLPGECECQVVEVQVLGCTDTQCPNYDPNVNCDDGSCSLKVFDLALRKEFASTEPFTVGTTTNITFTITIYNEGNLPAQNIELIDYIPTGLILNDANWTQSGVNAVTTIAGPLSPGGAISIEITFTIDTSLTADTYINYAEIIGAKDIFGNSAADIDSTPDTNNDYENENEDDHDGAEFTLIDHAPCQNNNAGYFCE